MIRRIWSCLLFVALAGAFAAAQTPSYPPPEAVRADFRRLLERPRVEANPEFHTETRDGFTFATGSFASEATERVPTLMVRKAGAGGRLPVVVALHGTGGNKEDQLGLLKELAGRGYLAVAIDARHHGQRVAGGAKGAQQYNEAVIRAWRAKPGEKQEHPFWYDTAFDLWRLVDYLVSRPDVDAERIGMIGFSMGGIQVWLAASVDTRIRASVPAIAVQSLRWSLEHDRWQDRAFTIRAAHEAAAEDLGEPKVTARVCRELWAKIIPGVLDAFDCPSMIRLFAPRPLLILSGEQDRNCPLEGAKLAYAQAQAAYQAAGAEGKLTIDVAAGVGHSVTPAQRQKALEWFDRELKQ